MKFLERMQLEGPCDPYPFALFRISFYTGVMLHFAPSLLWWEENYGPLAYRLPRWNETLFNLYPTLPQPLLQGAAILTLLACFWGLIGFLPRLAAITAGLGLYAFTSFNALNTSTVALISVWAIFTLLAVAGGGDEVWSAGNFLFRRKARPGDKWGRTLILYTITGSFFFAGVEKVIAGWIGDNPMHSILLYPPGFVLRDWAAASTLLSRPWVGQALGYATLGAELLLPAAMLWPRTRIAGVGLYLLFFAGILMVLEVPPLFGFIYGAAGLLALPTFSRTTVESRSALPNFAVH